MVWESKVIKRQALLQVDVAGLACFALPERQALLHLTMLGICYQSAAQVHLSMAQVQVFIPLQPMIRHS